MSQSDLFNVIKVIKNGLQIECELNIGIQFAAVIGRKIIFFSTLKKIESFYKTALWLVFPGRAELPTAAELNRDILKQYAH